MSVGIVAVAVYGGGSLGGRLAGAAVVATSTAAGGAGAS